MLNHMKQDFMYFIKCIWMCGICVAHCWFHLVVVFLDCTVTLYVHVVAHECTQCRYVLYLCLCLCVLLLSPFPPCNLVLAFPPLPSPSLPHALSSSPPQAEFLSREQCNEWRGAMMLVYIAIQYCDMEQVSAVCVALYRHVQCIYVPMYSKTCPYVKL